MAQRASRSISSSGYGGSYNNLGGVGGVVDPTLAISLNNQRQKNYDDFQNAVKGGMNITQAASKFGVNGTPGANGTVQYAQAPSLPAVQPGDIMNTNPMLAGILAQRESEAQMATAKLRQFGYGTLMNPNSNVLGAGGSIFQPRLLGV